MEHAAHKLLEVGTQRSLHVAGFARSSAHASAVLTDLLARYISLLATTAAKYAQHAGRTTVTPTDALSALDDLGVGVQDLIDYMPEAKELARYAIYSARRVEELHEFRAQLGRSARDDAFPLHYDVYEGDEEEEEEEEEDDDDDEEPGSPPSKRQRTLDWGSHIPDFLPPFPTTVEPVESPRPESPHPMPPPLHPAAPLVPQLTATSTSAADYLLQVPYAESSLADVPEWHLPAAPPPAPSCEPLKPEQPEFALQPEYALLHAFRHILKHPAPRHRDPATSTPARHRVAMALLTHTQLVPRWDLPDTMHAASGPAPPRAWPIAQRRFPPTLRPVAAPDRLAPLVGSQASRLPDLSRRVLPPPIFARATRLAHPPPLTRGSKLLTYGPGTPAPWNAPDDIVREFKDKEPPRVPDARVYATWEYETKDFRAPLRRPRVHAPSAPTPSRRSSRAV
ncbi:hypothetical protein B0H10DRAFT_2441043 [Mycena sp. CBHHK59/15]|nr:hypothetical protein B0H10DRAFT_2441043 [Mycena sp. CBHHK59/15]